jgi:hypothetical protein
MEALATPRHARTRALMRGRGLISTLLWELSMGLPPRPDSGRNGARRPSAPRPTPGGRRCSGGLKQSTFCMVHRKPMITMGSPYFVWINTNGIISSWYLLGAGCVAPPKVLGRRKHLLQQQSIGGHLEAMGVPPAPGGPPCAHTSF